MRALERAGGDLDIKALRGDLEGFYRIRIGDYRIVYHHGTGSTIFLAYADLREEVYEAFKLRALRESDE